MPSCVDRSYPAIKIIRENVGITKEPEKFTVLKMDAKQALKEFVGTQQQFDLYFFGSSLCEARAGFAAGTNGTSGSYGNSCGHCLRNSKRSGFAREDWHIGPK